MVNRNGGMLCAGVAAVGLAGVSAARGAMAYGVTQYGGVWLFDTTNPASVTRVGGSFGPIEGLELEASGLLLAVTYDRQVWELNPATGVQSHRGYIQLPPGVQGFAKDLSRNPVTGRIETLFLDGLGQFSIWDLDETTLDFRRIGTITPLNLPFSVGFAHDGFGRRSIVSPFSRVVYDLEGPDGLTAVARPQTTGLSYDALGVDRVGNGAIYAAAENGTWGRINPDGSATVIGNFAGGLALTDVVILPGCSALLILAAGSGLALARRRPRAGMP